MSDFELPDPPWHTCRGPWPGMGRGPGRPWAGIVEDTQVVWITWLVTLAKRMGKPVEGLRMEIDGTRIPTTSVELTFGRRYYFRCPECNRRCEAIYFPGGRVACRQCLHLGYRSQCHVRGSPWPIWERIFNRRAWFPRRWQIPSSVADAFAEMIQHKAERAAEEIIQRVRIWEERAR
jgi:hypothetical protein